jgi:hypothetical protein
MDMANRADLHEGNLLSDLRPASSAVYGRDGSGRLQSVAE